MNASNLNLHAPAPRHPWKGLGCLEDPFRVRFDERFVYLSDGQQREFECLVQSVRVGGGLSLITGAAGSGKTTLLSCLAADLTSSTPLIFFFATPPQTLASLVQECREQAGEACTSPSAPSDPAAEFQTFLSGFDTQALPLLLIDEAQSLADGVLADLLRLAVSGNDTGSGGKRLLQMVLAGNPSLLRRLQTEPVRSLSGPLGCHYRVPALARPQVVALIRHRLTAAGCQNCHPFSDDAVARIADFANGVVGTVNNLCRLALFFSAKAGEDQVTVQSVDRGASAILLNPPGKGISAPPMSSSVEPEASRDRVDGLGVGVADGQTGPSPVETAARSVGRANCEKASSRDPEGPESAASNRDLEPARRGIPPSDRRSHGLRWVRLVAAMSLLAATGSLLAIHVSSLKSRASGSVAERVAAPLPSDALPIAPVTAEKVYAGGSEPAGADPSHGEMPVQVSTAALSSSPFEDGGPANDFRDRQRDSPVAMALRMGNLVKGDIEIDSLLAQAKAHFDADRLVAPRFDNALAIYRQILHLSPGYPSALYGVAAVRARLFTYAQAESERGDVVSSRSYLQKIRSIDAEWGHLGEDVSELTGGALDSQPRLSPPQNLRTRLDKETGRPSP